MEIDSDEEEFECPLCYCDVPFNETFSLICNHRSCYDCYQNYAKE